MKKVWLFLLMFLFPLEVLAYSNYIIPGGETLGIEVNSKGIMIIGFYEINGKFNKGNPNLKIGDYITKVNDEEVSTIKELTSIIEKNVQDSEIFLTVKRNDKEKNIKLPLVKDEGIYKTGLYVKDSIMGIGTLSYIDPETKIYGALGHEIIETNSNSIVEIKTGVIFKNSITGIDRSTDGSPGSKNAKFYYNEKYGSIDKNTKAGIYGTYKSEFPTKDLMEVAKPNEVKIGDAEIYTVVSDSIVEKFKINIKSINENADIKNISFEITDEALLNKTGGIVQGMSGSPIIQNGKIIGAVTHVVIDNPTNGYGIFITKMLEEGEK